MIVLDLIRIALVVFVWFILLIGLGAAVMFRWPKRFLFALITGLSTGGMLLLSNLVSSASDQFNWLDILAFSSCAFVIGLVGTYLVPLLQGTTWEAYIADIKHQTSRR